MLNLRKMYGKREVTRLSYGNVLLFGLSMLNGEKMYGNACGNVLNLW